MKIEDLYLNTLNQLKKNERPRLGNDTLSPSELLRASEKALIQEDLPYLKKVLCLISYFENQESCFWPLIFHLFTHHEDEELLITALSLSRYHIIELCLKEGISVPQEFLVHLKVLFFDKRPEVFFHSMLTLDHLGPHSLKFKEDLKKYKFPFLKCLFSPNASVGNVILKRHQKKWNLLFEKK